MYSAGLKRRRRLGRGGGEERKEMGRRGEGGVEGVERKVGVTGERGG